MNEAFQSWLPAIAVVSFGFNIVIPSFLAVFWVIAKEKLRQEFVLKSEMQSAQNTAGLQIDISLQKMISAQDIVNTAINSSMKEFRKDLQLSVEVQKELRQDVKLLISHASMAPRTVLQQGLASPL